MTKKLKCNCGICNTCLSRVRMQKYRAKKQQPEARVHMHGNKVHVALPASSGELAARADNLFIWIEGRTRSYDSDTFAGCVYFMLGEIDREIRGLKAQISSYRTKRSGKSEYWYRCTNRVWKYIGPVKDGDPRDPLYAQVEKLDASKNERRELARMCIVKELGRHLLVDADKFKKHVNKSLPRNIIMLKEVLA